MDRIGLLSLPPHTPDAQTLFDEDREELGYVMNASRLWSYQPGTVTALFELMGKALADADFSPRQRGILVCAAASSLGDSYCSLAWGSKLSKTASPTLAAAVLSGDDTDLADDDRMMATCARRWFGSPTQQLTLTFRISETPASPIRKSSP